MLPEELCNNLCSLREGVIRLTVSVLMEFDKSGTLIKQEICRGYIKSKKRLSYGQAKKILDGKTKSPYLKNLELMRELCYLLKAKRAERGSIDFSLADLVILVDEKGEPTKTHVEEYDITHQMVEEFMLKANEVVATNLSKKGKGAVYRIHDEPSVEDLTEFDSFARILGFALPPKPTKKDYQALFEAAKESPQQALLAVAFIRKMKLALYSPGNIGHFGLALEYYCHFTSPIRRYSDTVIERLLFDEEGDVSLDKVAKQCSEKERISYRAEVTVKLLKKLRLLKRWQEEDPARQFDAIVTKIKPFGVIFEMKDLLLEGFLHVSELSGDFYEYNPDRPALVGKSTGKIFQVGSEFPVLLKSVDLIQLEAEWELEKVARAADSSRRAGGRRRKDSGKKGKIHPPE
jgi:ribonuclease R